MLKRRASKRFVLAETGEQVAWDTTTDNDRAPCPTTPGACGGPGYRRDSTVEIIVAPPSEGSALVSPTLQTSTSMEETQIFFDATTTTPTEAATEVTNNIGVTHPSTSVDGSRLTSSTTTGPSATLSLPTGSLK